MYIFCRTHAQIVNYNPRFKHPMQLEQSGYRISHAILSRIPRSAFLACLGTLVLLMLVTGAYMYSSKPTFTFAPCLHEYFQRRHTSIDDYLTQQLLHNNKSTISSEQFLHAYKLLNSSTLVKFEMSNQVDACTIAYNIDLSQQQAPSADGTEHRQTLAYMMSNYPLFNFNLSDAQLLAKHKVVIDKITLPEEEARFRYLGGDEATGRVEDFLYRVMQEFRVLDRKIKDGWYAYLTELMGKIKDMESSKTQSDKNDGTKPQNKTETNADNKGDTSTDVKGDKNAEVKLEKPGKANLVVQPIRTLEQDKAAASAQQTKQILNPDSKKNQQTPSAQELLHKKYITFLNLFSLVATRTTFAQHRLMYRLQPSPKWYPVYTPSVLSTSQTGPLLSTLFKLLFALITFFIFTLLYQIIGWFVRYIYIATLTLASVLCRSRLSKYVGWLHRYTDIVGEGASGGHLGVQVGAAMVGIYLLYALMGYFLLSTLQMVFITVDMLPTHPAYSGSLVRIMVAVELCHYIFFRSRISLSFFPKFAMANTLATLLFTSYHPHLMPSAVLHLHLLSSAFLVVLFLLLQKLIEQDPLQSPYRPSLTKPRMLFYIGYDLDWHRNVPPIWTQFQKWFDLSYASQMERAYVDRNYELLYGRLMGINEPQEFAEEGDESEGEALVARPE